MGIRYYAYAFDSDLTAAALADPYVVIGSDPLADAWGFEPGSRYIVTDFRQSLPERELLYLDKAWSTLQRLTAPHPGTGPARPAYRMFEGGVTSSDEGWGWHPWVRALPPEEVALIAQDLSAISGRDVEELLDGACASHPGPAADLAYVTDYLDRAKEFVNLVASEGRGFAYLIG